MLSLYLAPLQGFTESAYREAHFLYAGGIEAYYTPFLRVEKGTVREKDLRDLREDIEFIQTHPSPQEMQNASYRVIPQIISKDATEFNVLVDAIEELHHFNEIDINMGCPFPMQAKSGRGSGILPQIDKVEEILTEIAKRNRLHFSIKMRLGYTAPSESLALLPLLNEAPLKHITMHPRLGIQQYKGALDFDGFQKFFEGCKHPVIFNGNITTIPQINEIEKRFPTLKGLMIGRGLLANPSLAAQYQAQAAQQNARLSLQTLLKIHDYVLTNYRKRLQGDAQILDKIRPFWTYPWEISLDNPSESILPKRIFKKLEKARNLKDYLSAVEELAC